MGRPYRLDDRDLADLARVALDVALEALTEPAYIVARDGHIERANSGGLAQLAARGKELEAELQRAARGGQGHYRARAFVVPNVGEHVLLVHQPPDRLEACTSRWRLTPREAQVLDLLARGQSNQTIARQLSCAERTIEAHITRLLEKSGNERRSQLIAAFWTSR